LGNGLAKISGLDTIILPGIAHRPAMMRYLNACIVERLEIDCRRGCH